MNPKHKEPHIPPKEENENAFLNCKLGRKKYAEVLTGVIESFDDGFVLGLDNKWGNGKTTFVKMWKQSLDNDGFQTLYFNAWENDFETDVLVAMISELGNIKDTVQDDTFKSVIDKAAPLVKKLLPSVGKAIAKRYLGDEFTKEMVEGVFEVGAEELSETMEAYTNRKQSIKDFRESLEKFAKASPTDKPIVFFIDELDRCRPNYAVEVLEQIKHFFSIKGIVFVLSVDKEQLGHAIRGVYGSDLIDADEYLRRFIDIEYSLPEPDTKLFCEYLFDYYKFDEFFHSDKRLKHRDFQNDANSFKEFSFLLFSSNQLSLRQIERVYAHSRISISSFPADSFLFPEVYLYLIVLRLKKPELFSIIRSKTLDFQELLNEFADSIQPQMLIKELDEHKVKYVEYWLLRMYAKFIGLDMRSLISEKEGTKYSIYKSKLKVHPDNDNLEKWLTTHDVFMRNINLAHLLDRIDLLEKIQKV